MDDVSPHKHYIIQLSYYTTQLSHSTTQISHYFKQLSHCTTQLSHYITQALTSDPYKHRHQQSSSTFPVGEVCPPVPSKSFLPCSLKKFPSMSPQRLSLRFLKEFNSAYHQRVSFRAPSNSGFPCTLKEWPSMYPQKVAFHVFTKSFPSCTLSKFPYMYL